ncbi:MAG: hypothetical protein Q7R47_04545 [Candidatus Diapherotrites archaeon]|nr:hypothetical protein [Candidatus Diapherotrites archaeon]
MAERIKLIQELKRRGYSVVETVDNALLIEKDTFWGKFGYDAGVGLDVSKIKWGRTIILAIAYGIGIIGGLYWLYRKGQMKQEVVSIIV